MTLNTLKNEHLLPGEKPLHISFDHIKVETIKEVLYLLWFGRWVDWYSSPLVNKMLNNTNPEPDSYVISEISTSNKHSRWYYDCTWVVIIGKNSKWKNISLLSHQDPKYLFCRFDAQDCKNRFQNDLQTAIDKFKIQALPGTIDACILWGNYEMGETEFRGKIFDVKGNYLQSIELLDSMIQKNFWFSPVVASPMFDAWFTDIYLDTKHKRIVQRRRLKEDFMFLENTLFAANELEKNIPILDEMSIIKQTPLWQILT